MLIINGVLTNVSSRSIINGVLTIPSNVSAIDENAFLLLKRSYNNLRKLVIPGSVTEIPKNMLSGHIGLEELWLEEGVKIIGSSAFNNCTALKEIYFPDSIEVIEFESFENTAIKKFESPKNLIKLEEGAFSKSRLREVDFSNSEQLKKIEGMAFYNCDRLKFVKFGNKSTIEEIKDGVFSETSVDNITFPKSLRILDASNVQGLKNITLNDGLEELRGTIVIDDEVYTRFENLKIPKTLKRLETASITRTKSEIKNVNRNIFLKTEKGNVINLTEVVGNEIVIKSNYDGIHTITGKNSVFILEDSVLQPLNMVEMLKVENAREVIGDHNADKIYVFLNVLKQKYGGEIKVYPKAHEIEAFPLDRIDDYIKNRKIINNISKNISKEAYATKLGLMKFALNLGVLEQNEGVKNFIITLFREHIFSDTGVKIKGAGYLNSIKGKEKYEYNKKLNSLIEDIFKNYKDEKFLVDYLITAVNDFDKIVKLKRTPTLETVHNYSFAGRYKNITKDNFELATSSAIYDSIDEEKFKTISQMYVYSKRERVKNFIDYIHAKTGGGKVNTDELLEEFKDVSDTNFTYEWLQKDSVPNALLGYICDSCAKVDGVGENILRASILQPNVQNLVVKTKNGSIIAKGTAFLDKTEGIIVFNNVEVNQNFADKNKNRPAMLGVWNAFKRGIEKMTEVYNAHAKELGLLDIQKINMGMLYNDLSSEIYSESDSMIDKNQYTNADLLGYSIESMTQYTIYESQEYQTRKTETKEKSK